MILFYLFLLYFIPLINIVALGLYFVDEFISNFMANYYVWLTKK